MDSVKSVVHKFRCSVIPVGLIPLVQPADVSCNKSFKEAYKSLYNDWIILRQAMFELQVSCYVCNGSKSHVIL